jgi:uncharacterized cupin superfamily protein
VSIDSKEYSVERGSSISVPGDAEHGIRNEGDEDLRWFCVFPTALFGGFVYRFSDEIGAEGPELTSSNIVWLFYILYIQNRNRGVEDVQVQLR